MLFACFLMERPKKRGVGHLSRAPALTTTDPSLQPSMPIPIQTTVPLPAVAAALPVAAAPPAASAAPSAAPVGGGAAGAWWCVDFL